MPYLKPKKVPFISVRRLLLSYRLNARQLSMMLGCSWSTAQRKMESPELWTLKELMSICSLAHIPVDEMREAIQKGGAE